MNAGAHTTWLRRVVWGVAAVVFGIGCQPLTIAGFIFHRPATVKPEYEMRPPPDSKRDDKEEVRLAVLCTMSGRNPQEFAGADRELASLLVKKFPQVIKDEESKTKLTLVPAATVDRFKSANPNWKAMHPSAIGKQLKADYVMDVTLSGMQMYQPGTNNDLFEGRAQVNVDLYATDSKDKEPKQNYVLPFTWPGMARSAEGTRPEVFKKTFMDKLARALILRHVEHKASDGIADGDDQR